MANKLIRNLNLNLIRTCNRIFKMHTYPINDAGYTYNINSYSTRTLTDIVYNILQKKSFTGIRLLQIGAHDGSSNNLIDIKAISSLPNSECILIEPNPSVFGTLQELYKENTGVQCLNIAIDSVDRIRSFYAVECSEDIPEWATQLSAFDIQQILKFKDRVPNIERHVRQIDVTCRTFEGIARQFSDSHIDILLIDVEGYDAEIVKSIPFHSIAPQVIVFEHTHLPLHDIRVVIDLLCKHDYLISATDDDVIAFKIIC